MSYAESTTALATHLARLLAARATDLGHNGFEQALLSREVTLTLAREVHRHLTGGSDPPSNRQTKVNTADPVRAFGQALTDHHQVTRDLSPAEALSAIPSTPAGREWHHAARHALLADDAWRDGSHSTWTRARSWAALADVAAVTEALTVLDHDLAPAARALGRDRDAQVLERSTASSLRRAAAEVQAHARFGPLTAVDVASPRRTNGHVVLVRSDADLPAAEARLAELLSGARHLRPEHAVQVALGQARCAAAVAGLLRAAPARVAPGSGLGPLAEALDGAAHALASATTTTGRIGSLYRGDSRPLLQAGELTRHLRTGTAATGRDVTALVRFARALPDVVDALFDVARRHTAGGFWLVPTQDHAPTWTRYHLGLRESPLLAAAAPALATVQHLRCAPATFTANTSPPVLPPPARTVLGGALTQAQRHNPMPPPPTPRSGQPHRRGGR